MRNWSIVAILNKSVSNCFQLPVLISMVATTDRCCPHKQTPSKVCDNTNARAPRIRLGNHYSKELDVSKFYIMNHWIHLADYKIGEKDVGVPTDNVAFHLSYVLVKLWMLHLQSSFLLMRLGQQQLVAQVCSPAIHAADPYRTSWLLSLAWLLWTFGQ